VFQVVIIPLELFVRADLHDLVYDSQSIAVL